MPAYKILEHTADIGFRAWGMSAADLFANAAHALMAIAAGPGTFRGVDNREVVVSGHDYESLMVNWLEEILYLFDTGRFAACAFTIDEISPSRLSARLTGEPREPALHPWKLIVKAVTYHQIEVAERDGQWTATVFLDV